MTLITPSYISNDNWKDFLTKRALRIIPLYWLLSLFSLLVSTSRGGQIPFEKIMKTLLFFPVFDDAFTFPIIPVGWSLSLEIYFYGIVALLLAFAGRHIYKVLILLLLGCPALGYLLKPESQLLRFLLSPMLCEFAFGVLAGLIFKQVNATRSELNIPKLQRFAIGATVLGFGLMLLNLFTGFGQIDDAVKVSEHPEVAFLRVAVWGVPCSIFLTGFVLMENLFQFKMPKYFVKLGDASYSCYLLHTTILIPLAMKIFRISDFQNGDIYVFFSMTAILCCSLAFYEWGEKYLNRIIHSSYLSKKNASRNLLPLQSPVANKEASKFRKAS